MEVKMQYLVDLEDVPKECKVLLDGIDLPEWDILIDVSSFISEGEIVNSIRELESFRKELYRIDRRTADVSHILKGYLQAKIAQTKPNISAEADTEEDQQENLERNIKNYQNSLKNVETGTPEQEEEIALRELTEMIMSGLQTQVKETK